MKKLGLILLLVFQVFAFKPFYYEDADVEPSGKMEIELGIFDYERVGKSENWEFPTLKFDVGVLEGLEMDVEYIFLRGERISQVNLYIKGLFWRKGKISMGCEAGFFFPRDSEQGNLWGQILFMAGIEWGASVFHINIGWAKEEAGTSPFVGAIYMGPLWGKFRPVGELTWDREGGTVLLGFMLEEKIASLGFGVRRGISQNLFSVVLGISREF